MYYVWFYIDGSPNLHKETVKADSAARAAQFIGDAWPYREVWIQKVELV